MRTCDTISSTRHRPWPLPREPWILFQGWRDLLFAHYFFSLDAPNRLAVMAALLKNDHTVTFSSIRRRGGSAEFAARYRGIGDEFTARPNTLEHFLVDPRRAQCAHNVTRITH